MSLRIQRGRFKNRAINTVTTDAVRPTTGRVRQRIFDTLSFLWAGSTGVDAFAGSGIIGFEALSAGAQKVYACESSKEHARFILESQALLNLEQSEHQLAVRPFAGWWKVNAPSMPRVEWVYLDPPYQFKDWDQTLRLLVNYPCLSDGCFLIVEQGNSPEEAKVVKDLLDDESLSLELYKHIDCGDTQVWLLQVIR